MHIQGSCSDCWQAKFDVGQSSDGKLQQTCPAVALCSPPPPPPPPRTPPTTRLIAMPSNFLSVSLWSANLRFCCCFIASPRTTTHSSLDAQTREDPRLITILR